MERWLSQSKVAYYGRPLDLRCDAAGGRGSSLGTALIKYADHFHISNVADDDVHSFVDGLHHKEKF